MPESKPETPDKDKPPDTLPSGLSPDIWLPEVGTKVDTRRGWRALLANMFQPYR
jgi:hypothetical protein